MNWIRCVGGPPVMTGYQHGVPYGHEPEPAIKAAEFGVAWYHYTLDTSVTPPAYRFDKKVPWEGEWPPRSRAVDEALARVGDADAGMIFVLMHDYGDGYRLLGVYSTRAKVDEAQREAKAQHPSATVRVGRWPLDGLPAFD